MNKLLLFISFCILSVSAYPQDKENKLEGIGIEVPMSLMHSNIDLPLLLQDHIKDVEGGLGINMGLGITYQNDGHLNLRGGFHIWNSPFKPKVHPDANDDGDYIFENGFLTYYGLYLRGEWGNKYFFIGGGFDFSVANSYKADRYFYENYQKVDQEFGVDNSVLTSKFSNQVYIVANIGFKIPIKHIVIKPFASIGAAFTSVFKTPKVTTLTQGPGYHIYYDTPQTVDLQYIPVLNFGISTEYKF